jgi:enoyl-CoA hydratase/carnithine racemase
VRDGEIAVVEIFRPEVKNALSKQTLGEIDRTMTTLLADSTVRGVVLTSVDGALAGADILELAALKTPNECREICLFAHPIFARIENATKPIIAALDGPVMGGGAELSMACHARVVGKGLIMSQPEVNLGIIPGYGGTQRLPRLIGLERANLMLRTAHVMTAAEACQSGWAHGEPVANARSAAIDLLKSCIAGKTTLTRIDTKPMTVDKLAPAPIGFRSKAIDAILTDVMRRGLSKPLAEGLALEADGFARCKQTVDMDIGMKNFMQNGPRVPAVFLHE